MTSRLLIVAGEASGDNHGGQLVEQFKQLRPELDLCALGGKRMEQAGAELLLPLAERGVTGIIEVARSIPFFRQALATVAEVLTHRRPDGVVLIDFPGFNFRVARLAHARGIPVLYYISPQLWAWHASRVWEMKKWLRKIFVIFPFEVDLYEKAGIAVEFVGNPLMDAIPRDLDRTAARAGLDCEENTPLVGLLPGSREGEIERLLPTMLDAATRIAQRLPQVRFVLPLAETLSRSILEPLPKQPPVRIIERPTYEQRAAIDFALTASGTATLENALLGVPMAVVYRTAWLSYLLARILVRVEHIGMVNLLAGKTVCREFIQHEATGRTLADYACEVLESATRQGEMRRELHQLRELLGEPGAAKRAAVSILNTLDL